MFKREIIDLRNAEAYERIENVVWPSESLCQLGPCAIGECKRALFYKILGVTPTNPMSIKGRYTCDAGNMYEQQVVDRFRYHNLYKDAQIRLEFELPGIKHKIIHSGKMDIVIEDEGISKGIEVKSISAYRAEEVMGSDRKVGLPPSYNLMQAGLYKYCLSHTDSGKSIGIDEVYLLYVNRNDGTTHYYKIDLDDDGYPVITSISQAGKEGSPIRVQQYPSYQDFIDGKAKADDTTGRMASLRFRPEDIFNKFDLVYEYKDKNQLPPKDFSLVYSSEEIEKEFLCGRISSRKYKAHKDGKTQYGDYKCSTCSYQKKCLQDDGVTFK